MAEARRYGAALVGIDGLDIVPDRWLHFTVQGVGFAEDVTAGELAALVDVAGSQLSHWGALELTANEAEVHAEGVVVPAWPAEHVVRLRARLRSAISEALGRERLAGGGDEPMWPHMSLAYANCDAPAAPVLRALASVAYDPLTIGFDRVSLIQLGRDGRCYIWSEVADVALTPRSA